MSTKCVSSDSHLGTLGSGLWQLRSDELTTDAWLYCTESLIPVHRAVLAACSPYFEKVVAAVTKVGSLPVIVLPRAQPEQMLKLLEYMYLGKMDIDESEISGMDGLAKYFKMDDLCLALATATEYAASPTPASHKRREPESTSTVESTVRSEDGPAPKKKKLRGPKTARNRASRLEERRTEEQADSAADTVEEGDEPAQPLKSRRKHRTETEESSSAATSRRSDVEQELSENADGEEEVDVDGQMIVPPRGMLKPPKGQIERIGWMSYSGTVMENGSRKQVFFCGFEGCNHKAKYRRGLNAHEREHLRLANYTCPMCVYGFGDFDSLRDHVLNNHSEDEHKEEREHYEDVREALDDDDVDSDEEVNGLNDSSASASDDEVAVSVSSSHRSAFDSLLMS